MRAKRKETAEKKKNGAARVRSHEAGPMPASYTLPERRRPKGCELLYLGKAAEETVLRETPPARLREIRRIGDEADRLILGDNLSVLKTLHDDPRIRRNVSLIYIDPPFGTGQDFAGRDETCAYSDRIANAEFLEFLRRRLIFLRELLSEGGSIYVHVDQKMGHYVKVLLDEVFGERNFRNDIARVKCNPKSFSRKAYGNVKDVIYFYSKARPPGGDPMIWNDLRESLTGEEMERRFPRLGPSGRRYATVALHAPGEVRNGRTGSPWKGLLPPKGKHWQYPPSHLTKLDREGRIEWSSSGNPRRVIYADEAKGKKIQDIWAFKDPGRQRSLYPTQKNEELLTRIIRMSSRKGDVVLDCFCGSGTALAVAQKLGRRWIGVDSNPSAIKAVEQRLADIPEAALNYRLYVEDTWRPSSS